MRGVSIILVYYRFDRDDNLIAADHFERATTLDPDFARAYAARSFASFQTAFLKYNGDAVAEIANAQEFAEKCLELDPVDPFGNFVLGRAYWSKGDPKAGMPGIDRALMLSPNFAQGFYAHRFWEVMAERGAAAPDQLDKVLVAVGSEID